MDGILPQDQDLMLSSIQSDAIPTLDKKVVAEEHRLYLNDESLPLTAVLEALLFVADGPIEVAKIAKALKIESERIIQGLQGLDQYYQDASRGLRVQTYNGKYQLVTRPSFATIIESFLSLDLSAKLSAPALETLAIVAYRQPVTRVQIEAIRGVDSSAILRSLVQRGLIQECGRLDGVGRPILYGVTESFMHYFGLTGLDELPPLETTEADALWAATTLAEPQATGNQREAAEG